MPIVWTTDDLKQQRGVIGRLGDGSDNVKGRRDGNRADSANQSDPASAVSTVSSNNSLSDFTAVRRFTHVGLIAYNPCKRVK